MANIAANDPRVIAFVQKYHADKERYGDRYYHYYKDSVHVHLPRDLAHFSNAAAGVMDDGQPRGIRVKDVNPEVYLSRIFGSYEAFAAFLNASPCDYKSARNYGAPRKLRKKVVVVVESKTDDRPCIQGTDFKLRVAIREYYKYERKAFERLVLALTTNEFQLMFGKRENNFDLSGYLAA
jgi:hypothetical protein